MDIKILILLPVCDPWNPLLYDVLTIKAFSIESPEKKHLYKYCVKWSKKSMSFLMAYCYDIL